MLVPGLGGHSPARYRRPPRNCCLCWMSSSRSAPMRPSARPQRRLPRATSPRDAPQAARTAGCSRWPTESAGRSRAKLLRVLAVESMLAGFRAAARRRIAHCAVAPPGAGSQRAGLRDRHGGRPGRRLHGHHPGRLRSALRPRGGGPRGRFALLSDPPRPGRAAYARSYRGQRAGADGNALCPGGRRGGHPPHAQPLAREPNCSSAWRSAITKCFRRCAVALLRWAARRRGRSRISPASSATRTT